MPFVEVCGPTHDVVINDTSLYIRKHVKDKYFIEKAFVQVFVDIENKLFGLMPSTKGYPVPKGNSAIQVRALKRYLLGHRKLKVGWNDNHQMLIAKL